MNRLRLLILTAAGTGLLKPAPGTWGSLVPVGLALLMMLIREAWPIQALMGLLVILASVACVKLGPWAEAKFGRSDPGEVVIDEVAGQALTLALLPWPWLIGSMGWSAIACGLALVSFRLFDILKPPPIDGLQRFPAGWGILLDDLAAGLAAAGLCWIVLLALGV